MQAGVLCVIAKTSDSITLTPTAFNDHRSVSANLSLKDCPTDFTAFDNEDYTMYTMISASSNQVNTYQISKATLPTEEQTVDLAAERVELLNIGEKASKKIITDDIMAKITALNLETKKLQYSTAKNALDETSDANAIEALKQLDSDLDTELSKPTIDYNVVLTTLNTFKNNSSIIQAAKDTRKELTDAQTQEAEYNLLKASKLKKIEEIFSNL